jgi:hypothetical protein
VLELKVLVGELVAVNGLAAGSVVVGKITALAHEILFIQRKKELVPGKAERRHGQMPVLA